LAQPGPSHLKNDGRLTKGGLGRRQKRASLEEADHSDPSSNDQLPPEKEVKEEGNHDCRKVTKHSLSTWADMKLVGKKKKEFKSRKTGLAGVFSLGQQQDRRTPEKNRTQKKQGKTPPGGAGRKDPIKSSFAKGEQNGGLRCHVHFPGAW